MVGSIENQGGKPGEHSSFQAASSHARGISNASDHDHDQPDPDKWQKMGIKDSEKLGEAQRRKADPGYDPKNDPDEDGYIGFKKKKKINTIHPAEMGSYPREGRSHEDEKLANRSRGSKRIPTPVVEGTGNFGNTSSGGTKRIRND